MEPGPQGTPGKSAIRMTGTLGNGSTAEFTITHNLNTRFVSVELFENGGNYLNIEADVRRVTLNAVSIGFREAPTSNQFGFVLLGPEE